MKRNIDKSITLTLEKIKELINEKSKVKVKNVEIHLGFTEVFTVEFEDNSYRDMYPSSLIKLLFDTEIRNVSTDIVRTGNIFNRKIKHIEFEYTEVIQD